ncbi:hypothetical protein PG987_012295 [Apiospora arundinis]
MSSPARIRRKDYVRVGTLPTPEDRAELLVGVAFCLEVSQSSLLRGEVGFRREGLVFAGSLSLDTDSTPRSLSGTLRS